MAELLRCRWTSPWRDPCWGGPNADASPQTTVITRLRFLFYFKLIIKLIIKNLNYLKFKLIIIYLFFKDELLMIIDYTVLFALF